MLAVGDEDGVQAGLEHPCGQSQAGLYLGLAGDVPERIHPPHGPPLAELRHGAQLQHQAISQHQNVGALLHRFSGDCSQTLRIGTCVLNLGLHVRIDSRIVAPHQQIARNIPQLRKPLIESPHPAIEAAHEHAVSGRIQRGAQLRQQSFQLALGRFLDTAIQHGQHEDRARSDLCRNARHLTIDRNQGAFSAQKAGVGMNAICNHLGRLPPERHVLRCGGQTQHGRTHHLGHRQAHQPLRGGIRVKDEQAGLIDQPDGLL